MNKRKYLVLIQIIWIAVSHAQTGQDTTALMDEFTHVMSCTSQKYVHYITNTKLNAIPVLDANDTLNIKGEFFKNNTNIYSNNGRDEMYLEDSLMIEINNDRKTIWIHRVDITSKEKMNIISVNSKEMLNTMRNNYSVIKTRLNNEISRLDFETRKPENNAPPRSTTISIEYSEKTWFPQKIDIIINLKQQMDDEISAALKQEGVEENKVVQTIGGIKYFIRKQIMSVQFAAIDNAKESSNKMPGYNAVLEYNNISEEFTGKGIYKDYEITKTF